MLWFVFCGISWATVETFRPIMAFDTFLIKERAGSLGKKKNHHIMKKMSPFFMFATFHNLSRRDVNDVHCNAYKYNRLLVVLIYIKHDKYFPVYASPFFCIFHLYSGKAVALSQPYQCEHGQYARYRITESQNSRGWKGPLWVI